MRGFIVCICIFVSINTFSQNFSIVKGESLPTDLSATTHFRTDLNGKRCGLVKVQCVLDGVQFSGNIISNVEYKDGEHWVYITDGTKQLSIKHPMILPLDVDFLASLQGIVKSGNTYRLRLSIPDALYNSILTKPAVAPTYSGNGTIVPELINNTISGVVTDRKDGEPLIGCAVLLKNSNNGTCCDLDGKFTLENIKSGSTVQISYVGFKRKEITLPCAIPPWLNITLRKGHGTEKEDYFYDPNDKAEYFDLKGNKLQHRPSKKGTYIRVADGNAERFSVN